MKTFKLLSPRLLAASTLLTATLLYAASVFTPDLQPLGSLAPLEMSNTDLANGAKAYRTWFENGSWQGDLAEYDVTSTGGLSSDVIYTSASPVSGGTNWSANVEFASHDGDITYYDIGRKIITKDSVTNTQEAFRWGSLDATQKNDLDVGSVALASSNILNYVRGQRTNETGQVGGTFRKRYNLLGDIVHSNPVYVAAPKQNYTMNNYATFVSTNANRAPRVYVGANDGMLHAFDASAGGASTGGTEVYAYIPSMLIGELDRLASAAFQHRYFVDGGITVGDAFISGAWKSVLASGLGAGAKGVFMLDVTNPNLTLETAGTGLNKKQMWELAATADNDMGYVFGAPAIAKLNDGNWYAVFGNGYSSVNGIAKLYLLNLTSGAVTRLSTGSGSAVAPNGLSGPALVDDDSDSIADYAFAGDIDGNMWRFDLKSASPAGWTTAYKVFAAGATKPITTAPDVARNLSGGFIVYFATGRLLTTADATNQDIQSVFGIFDRGTAPGASNIRMQTMSPNINYTAPSIVETVRTLTNFSTTASHTAWQVDLFAGERVITDPQLRGGRLIMTVTNPLNKENFLSEFNYRTGGAVTGSIYDLNRDVVLNNADRVIGNADGDLTDPEDVPMIWQRSSGVMSQPTIARISNGVDTIFLNYLMPANPPVIEPCVGNCAGGIAGGHIDVDTDGPCLLVPASNCDNTDQHSYSNGFAGATTEHTHEYDDETGRTYVDFQGIENNPITQPGTSTESNQLRLNETIPLTSTEFVVIVANADLSPGATLQIVDRKWNAAAYQRMIHKKLRAWNGLGTAATVCGTPNALCDDGVPAGVNPVTLPLPPKTLIIKRSDLNSVMLGAGSKTIQQSFNGDAISSGGLIATKPECVMNNLQITNSRYRNASLTTQLVKLSAFNSYAALAGTTGKDYNAIGNFVAAGLGTQRQMLSLLQVQNPASLVDADGLKTPLILTDGTQIALQEDLNGDGDMTDAGSPVYEVYGGLYVKSVSGTVVPTGATTPAQAVGANMLYEAALFWHYSKEGTAEDADAVCYGAAGYTFQRYRFVATLTQAEYDALLVQLNLTPAQVDANAAAACTTGTTSQKNACKKKRTQAQQLLAMKAKIGLGAAPAPGTIPNPQPEVIAGDAQSQGITVGPNLQTGSRTWTDITPK